MPVITKIAVINKAISIQSGSQYLFIVLILWLWAGRKPCPLWLDCYRLYIVLSLQSSEDACPVL